MNRVRTLLNVFGVSALTALCLWLGAGLWHHAALSRRRAEQRLRSELRPFDVIRLKNLCYTLKEIYEYSGRRIQSIEELERSGYYPYESKYDNAFGGSSPFVEVVQEPGNRLYAVASKRNKNGQEIGRIWPVPIQETSREKATERLIAMYLSGVRERTKRIAEIRAAFVHQDHSGAEAYRSETGKSPTEVKIRELPSAPIAADLPRNERELASYLKWMRDTEGLPELPDGWGRTVEFVLRGQFLLAHSRGPDGKVRTRDDIQAQVIITNR